MTRPPKQELFVKEYPIDCNATQAAIRAGYSPKTAYRTGADLLRKPQVAELIAITMEERSERLGYTADWVLKEAVESYKTCKKLAAFGDAHKYLTLIAKHTDVGALRDKVEVESNITIVVDTGIPYGPPGSAVQ